jgi:uncharacterized protein DUF1698
MLRKVAARILSLARRATQPAGPAAPRAAILDVYVRTTPTPQNALDVFKGDWWSQIPRPPGLTAGQLPLFADGRITWAIEALGGVRDRTVLELGPLEAGHTYMLEEAGARSILAIEANTRAFLKCLIAKEVVGLHRSRFVLGDFEEYLRAPGSERFDASIASGVLYHVRNPVELIHNLARVTDRVFIWTHYYVKERVAAIEHMKHRFGNHEATPAEHAGFRHTLHRYNYGDFLDTTRFAGGSEEHSHWLSRDDLMGALRHAGFTEITVGEEEVEHTNGPSISLVAARA